MRKIANAFTYNSLFSAATGVLMIVRADFWPDLLFPAPSWFFTALGIGLLGFAVLIAFAVVQGIPRGLGLFITLQDGLWVLLTTIAMIVFWDDVTLTGIVVIESVNIAVCLFGFFQLRYMADQLAHPDPESNFTSRLDVKLPVASSPEQIWPLIADLDQIATYAPGVQSSRMVTGKRGVGAVRECKAGGDQVWQERITTWDDGEGFTLEFNTDDDSFPFPVSRMAGGWTLQPTVQTGGAEVSVFLEWAPKTRLARELAPVLAYMNENKLAQAIRNMDTAAQMKST